MFSGKAAGGESLDDVTTGSAAGALTAVGDVREGLCMLGEAMMGVAGVAAVDFSDVIAKPSCSSDDIPPGAAESSCCSFCDSCATGSNAAGDVTAGGEDGAMSSCLMAFSM